jgi:hypothetical protein
MSEAAPLPMAMAATREREEAQPPHGVTFPELVWAHHLRERELHREDAGEAYSGDRKSVV